VKRPILIAATAAVYLMAAWMVTPGFYDGFTPPQPYNWVSPPPQAPPGNQKPTSGHLAVKVTGGVSEPSTAFTDDGQVILSFLPGAFNAAGKTTVTVDIKPVATFPLPTGLHFATNVYLITADAPLLMDANLELRYSDVVPAPSVTYLSVGADGPWKSIGGTESQAYVIQTTTRQLGYVAAGYPANATSNSLAGGSQLLPIAVAVLILGVLIAGIPLALLRRRRASGAVEDGDDEEA
jgi:hypothetical protein